MVAFFLVLDTCSLLPLDASSILFGKKNASSLGLASGQIGENIIYVLNNSWGSDRKGGKKIFLGMVTLSVVDAEACPWAFLKAYCEAGRGWYKSPKKGYSLRHQKAYSPLASSTNASLSFRS
jgi:hypothetical protein